MNKYFIKNDSTNIQSNKKKEDSKYDLFDSDNDSDDDSKRVLKLFEDQFSLNDKKVEKEDLKYNLNDYSLIHWRPMLNELDFKIGKYEGLGEVNINELPNLIFYGLKGSGKTTKVHALLATMFGRNIYSMKNIEFEEDRKIIHYRASNYHIEFSSTEMNSNEKTFIHSFLKIFIQTKNVALNIPKIVYIHHAEKLSKQSQLALRRMIEVHYSTSRFIFEINDIGMLVGPLTSRCLCVRVAMPEKEGIINCMKETSIKYNFKIKDEDIDLILKTSIGMNDIENVPKIMFDLKKIFGCFYTFVYTGKIFTFYEHSKLDEIVQIIEKKKCNVTSMEKVRDIIQDLYIRLIPMNFCIHYIFHKIIDKYYKDPKFEDICINIIRITTKCEHLLKKGNKESLHVEYFIFSLCEYIQNIK